METTIQRVGGMLRKFHQLTMAAHIAREMQGLMRRRYQIRRYFVNERDFAGLPIGAGKLIWMAGLRRISSHCSRRQRYMAATERLPFDEGMFDRVVAEIL